MGESNTNDVFTEADIAEAERCKALGPAYFASGRIVERFMASFTDEQFKPLIDEFAKQFQDRLWTDVQVSLLSDSESNLQGELRRMVDGTVRALLTGEQWALNYFVLAKEKYGDAPKVRAAIAEHCGDEVQKLRIAELEAQVAKLQADAADLRGRY